MHYCLCLFLLLILLLESFFFRLQWAATCASICEIWRPNFYALSCASKLDISDITRTHTHLQLHIYFNCCSLELVLRESHLRAEMHETSSTLKFDTVWSIWYCGEEEWLHQCDPGLDSRSRRHIWLEFVIGSLLCSERFFSGCSGFPLSKTNTS